VTKPRRNHAIVFSFRDTVEGNGFLARVTTRGRALLANDDNSWWVYGVQPGAIADSGDSPQGAYASFRQAFTKVLFDFAAGAANFTEFERDVQAFIAAVDESEEGRWRSAVEALRSGEQEPEAPFDQLPRVNADEYDYGVVVERLDVGQRHFTPEENRIDEYALTNCA